MSDGVTETITNSLAQIRSLHVVPRTLARRGLLIGLSDYDTVSHSWPDGIVNRGHTAKGDVRWSEAVIHDVKNVGATATYAIRIEVK